MAATLTGLAAVSAILANLASQPDPVPGVNLDGFEGSASRFGVNQYIDFSINSANVVTINVFAKEPSPHWSWSAGNPDVPCDPTSTAPENLCEPPSDCVVSSMSHPITPGISVQQYGQYDPATGGYVLDETMLPKPAWNVFQVQFNAGVSQGTLKTFWPGTVSGEAPVNAECETTAMEISYIPPDLLANSWNALDQGPVDQHVGFIQVDDTANEETLFTFVLNYDSDGNILGVSAMWLGNSVDGASDAFSSLAGAQQSGDCTVYSGDDDGIGTIAEGRIGRTMLNHAGEELMQHEDSGVAVSELQSTWGRSGIAARYDGVDIMKKIKNPVKGAKPKKIYAHWDGVAAEEINCNSDSAVLTWITHGGYDGCKWDDNTNTNVCNNYGRNSLWEWYAAQNGDNVDYDTPVTICAGKSTQITCYAPQEIWKEPIKSFNPPSRWFYCKKPVNVAYENRRYQNCPEKNPHRDNPTVTGEKWEVFIVHTGSLPGKNGGFVNSSDFFGRGGNLSCRAAWSENPYRSGVEVFNGFWTPTCVMIAAEWAQAIGQVATGNFMPILKKLFRFGQGANGGDLKNLITAPLWTVWWSNSVPTCRDDPDDRNSYHPWSGLFPMTNFLVQDWAHIQSNDSSFVAARTPKNNFKWNDINANGYRYVPSTTFTTTTYTRNHGLRKPTCDPTDTDLMARQDIQAVMEAYKYEMNLYRSNANYESILFGPSPDILTPAKSSPWSHDVTRDPSPWWRVTYMGHSRGGGVAANAALRHKTLYPNDNVRLFSAGSAPPYLPWHIEYDSDRGRWDVRNGFARQLHTYEQIIHMGYRRSCNRLVFFDGAFEVGGYAGSTNIWEHDSLRKLGSARYCKKTFIFGPMGWLSGWPQVRKNNQYLQAHIAGGFMDGGKMVHMNYVPMVYRTRQDDHIWF